MEDNGRATTGVEKRLSLPGQPPFSFWVNIRETAGIKNAGCAFEVKGPDPKTNLNKTCRYYLENRDHNSYLDFFEKLTLDFGLRLPQNRQPLVEPGFRATYKEVIKENLTPSMIYGYGDPAVIRVEAGFWGGETQYYLLVTSNDAADSFPILRSRNLVDWEFVSFVFPRGEKPEWAADGALVSDYWAPEMHQVGQEFRVYFVARDKHSRELCIGMARSSSPEGPFVADKAPLLKNNVIDPHLLVEEKGTAFLYWKEDNNDLWPGRLNELLYGNPGLIPVLFPRKEDQVTACFIYSLWPWVRTLEPMERFFVQQVLIEAVIAMFSTFHDQLEDLLATQPAAIQQQIRAVLEVMRTPVYAQQLSDNGSELVGERTKVMENDLAWEAHLVEGMWVTRQGKKYYLFYAGNDFSTDQYGIGVAIADAPLGPYHKMQQPFLRSTAEWWAPGHPSVVTGPDGQPTLFLHAYYPGKAGFKQFRALLSVPVTFAHDRVSLRGLT
jgi:arabinan endo-1,5-alpha-L-arabinosidase